MNGLEIIQEKVKYPVKAELEKLKVGEILCYVAKGWRGVVFKAKLKNGKIVALKIGHPSRIEKESKYLKLANSAGVGPKFYASTEHIVCMQFLGGKPYPEFLETAGREKLKQIILKILDQAHNLDQIGLDHGQLSRADKHIIIQHEKPYLLDFEKASTIRKPRNMTAVLNFLVLSPFSFYAKTCRAKLNINTSQIKRYAREYPKSKREKIHPRLLGFKVRGSAKKTSNPTAAKNKRPAPRN